MDNINKTNQWDESGFYYICQHKFAEILPYLDNINYFTFENIKDRILLRVICYRRFTEILPYLNNINYFTFENINIKDYHGLTSFHYICKSKFNDILPYIINSPDENYLNIENLNIKNDDNLSGLEIACKRNWIELIEYLLNNIYLSENEFGIIEKMNNSVFNEKIDQIRNIGKNTKRALIS